MGSRGISGRLIELDGLRGITAIAVMFYHIEAMNHRLFPFGKGHLAVDFFFLLSGFVLGVSYEPRLRAGALGLGAYARARFARLWPMIVLGALIGLVVTILMGTQLPLPISLAFVLEVLGAPVLISGWGLYLLNGVQWSLFFEVVANAVHAGLAKRLSNVLLLVILGVSLSGLMINIAAFGSLNDGYVDENFMGGFARVFFSFFVGVGIARLYAGRRFKAIPRLPAMLPALALGLILVLPYSTGLRENIFDIVVLVAALPLILIAALATAPTGFEARAASFLGRASYPLYLIHYPILTFARSILNTPNVPHILRVAGWGGLAVGLPIVAWAIDQWIDLPVREWLSLRGRSTEV